MNEIKTITPQIDIYADDPAFEFESFVHCVEHDIPLKIRSSTDPYTIYVESCPECLKDQLKKAALEFVKHVEAYQGREDAKS